jgi:hypothetical protein
LEQISRRSMSASATAGHQKMAAAQIEKAEIVLGCSTRDG